MKRIFDICFSFLVLACASPFILFVIVMIYLKDGHSPFYIARRAGLNHTSFRMVKLRTMIVNADKVGGSSTAANDRRIMGFGLFLRRFKLDELTQFWNVLKGEMSVVGPRPQVIEDVARYTPLEAKMLTARPGITDLASIVFADEGEILKDYRNPDLAYNQVIRPWKSRLAILYVENRGLMLDLQIIFLTALAVLNRPLSLRLLYRLVKKYASDPQLLEVIKRTEKLTPFPPPGSSAVIQALD